MSKNPNARTPQGERRLRGSDFSDKENHFNILVQATAAFFKDLQELLILGEDEQTYRQDVQLIAGETDPERIQKRVSLSNKFLIDDMKWISQNGYPPISHYCGLKFVFDLYVAKKSEDKNETRILLDQILASQAALILQGHVDLAKDIFNAAGAFARLDQALDGMANNPFNGPNKDICKIRVLFKFLDFIAASKIPSQKALRVAMGNEIDDGQFSRTIKGMHVKMVIPEESKNPRKGQKDGKGTVYSLEALSPNFDEIEEAQEIAENVPQLVETDGVWHWSFGSLDQ